MCKCCQPVINITGDVYGVDDFERIITEAVDDSKARVDRMGPCRSVIQIQTGSGVVYPFPVSTSFGVQRVEDMYDDRRVENLRQDFREAGHTHVVSCQKQGGIPPYPILSGTEQECHAWLQGIAAALERAGTPVVLTNLVTYGVGPMDPPDPEDAQRWGKQ